MRKTKILATLGPACNDVNKLKELILAGMDAARINFSHGTHETHTEIINKLIQAREELGKPIPLVLDTKGPEIRTKSFRDDKVFLRQGQDFILTTTDIEGDNEKVSVTYTGLPQDVTKGTRILIDDGLIELAVESVCGPDITCKVLNSGYLSSKKGINVPGVNINLPALTQQDIDDIRFGVEIGFDYIAASFVHTAEDIIRIREVLESFGGTNIDIIAKIETRFAVDNIDSILEVADGIMVARGDLGVELPPEEVPLVQKSLISKANLIGKLVITATQMLESMVNNPRPTRAEANDVANAIFDGSDTIMLSGETAKGSYPVETVSMMARIAERTEQAIDYKEKLRTRYAVNMSGITNAVSHATCSTAADLNSPCIVTLTKSGFTARMVSRFRPICPLLAITEDIAVWRKLNLVWGCVPYLFTNPSENIFEVCATKAQETGLAKVGDAIVIVAGLPVGIVGSTNTLKVEIVGSVLAKGTGIGNKKVSGLAVVAKVIEEAERFFKTGDILITTETNNDWLKFIKKASAVVIGSDRCFDFTHTEAVARALEIPLVICNDRVTDLIKTGSLITVDSEKGYIFNGIIDE